jgi:hypothetical protein
MVADLVAEARALAGDDRHVAAAALTVDAGVGVHCFRAPRLDEIHASEAQAEQAVAEARAVGDARLESAAFDQLTLQQLILGKIRAGVASAKRRLDLLAATPSAGADPELAFELSDALHMAATASIAAGDLVAAHRYATRRRDLPFHRDEDHFVVNWLLVAAALAGNLDEAVELGARFRAGWERSGRPPQQAFAVTPAAAAMVAGLQGDDEAAREWLEVYTRMDRASSETTAAPSVYRPLFDAIVALHRGQLDAALAAMAEGPESLVLWHNALWRQWYAAVWAEAAVLAGRDDAADRLDRARAIVVDNPVATAMVERAAALAAGEPGRLVAIAAALGPACPYQRARTLVLAGGAAADEGRQLMADIHAAPMAEA